MEAVKERRKRGKDGRKERKNKKRRLYISPLTPLPFLCFCIFAEDLSVLAALTAAALHECGHIACLYAFGGKIERMEVLPFGGEIIVGGRVLSYKKSAVLALCGVFVNLVCALPVFFGASGFLFRFSACSLGLAFFNILPVRGLDGGNALCSFLLQFTAPETARRIVDFTSVFGAFFIIMWFIYGFMCSCFNPTLILLFLYLIFGTDGYGCRRNESL